MQEGKGMPVDCAQSNYSSFINKRIVQMYYQLVHNMFDIFACRVIPDYTVQKFSKVNNTFTTRVKHVIKRSFSQNETS